MTWEDILKLSEEDRKKFNQLGEEYAPEEMEEARRTKAIADAKAMLPVMENLVELIENTSDESERQRAMASLGSIAGMLGMARSPSRDGRSRLANIKAFMKNLRRTE
jgi:hypothetical protein